MSIFCNFWCVASVTRLRGSRGRVIRSSPCHTVASVMPRRMRFAQVARSRQSCGRVVASSLLARDRVDASSFRNSILRFPSIFSCFLFHSLSHSCLRRSKTTQHTNHGIEWN
ncbi:uncharacterized protein DS421_3g76350 [Arachis hypogaea]|nr:uncharacterized protein DS421_3g76350 [Arachis hypogaea]